MCFARETVRERRFRMYKELPGFRQGPSVLARAQRAGAGPCHPSYLQCLPRSDKT